MSERTYVSGYWPLAMNNKRRIDYYERLLPDSLTPLRGKCLIFFLQPTNASWTLFKHIADVWMWIWRAGCYPSPLCLIGSSPTP